MQLIQSCPDGDSCTASDSGSPTIFCCSLGRYLSSTDHRLGRPWFACFEPWNIAAEGCEGLTGWRRRVCIFLHCCYCITVTQGLLCSDPEVTTTPRQMWQLVTQTLENPEFVPGDLWSKREFAHRSMIVRRIKGLVAFVVTHTRGLKLLSC